MTEIIPDGIAESELRNEVDAALAAAKAALRRYRLGTAKRPTFILEGTPPPLPLDALKGCLVYSTREEMMRDLAIGACGAEVGVQYGLFSRFLLDTTGVETLHLFDINFDETAPEILSSDRTVVHKGRSERSLAALAGTRFDWIYIDGDHSYEGVRKDATVALTLLKEDGYLFFNDYIAWSALEMIPYGVMRCVNELVISEDLQFSAIALSPHGYFDVALRRRRLSAESP